MVDALIVINALNATKAIEFADYPTGEEAKHAMIDVDGGQRLTVNDALLVFIYLIKKSL